MRTYRVTVRGKFDSLTDDAKRQLLEELDHHDALHAQFTPEGSFTYDKALNAFSFRYVVEDEENNPEEAQGNAHTFAELAATELLTEKGYGFRDLRVESMDMDAMSANTRRLQK